MVPGSDKRLSHWGRCNVCLTQISEHTDCIQLNNNIQNVFGRLNNENTCNGMNQGSWLKKKS